jgi:ethanolamine utilization protein EutS
MGREEVQRVLHEYVPGKQITLAHLISNPREDIYKSLKLDDKKGNAIGILNITPGDGVIIAADISTKSSDVKIGLLDRFRGSLIIMGDTSSVESALTQVLNIMSEVLLFKPTIITRT